MSNFNKVFSVSVEPDEFFLLNETLFEQTMQLSEGQILLFDGTTRMNNKWSVLGVDWLIHDENSKGMTKPDIAGLGASTLVVSPMFSELFTDGFSDNCELLECRLNDEKWFAFNVVGFENALNEEYSIRNMRNGKPSRIRKFKKMVFTKAEIKNTSIFRVKEAGLFYYTTDAKNSLYSIVKEHNIKGLYFHEVNSV